MRIFAVQIECRANGANLTLKWWNKKKTDLTNEENVKFEQLIMKDKVNLNLESANAQIWIFQIHVFS